MTNPHPAYGSHAPTNTASAFWHRRGLLAPHEREWRNGECLSDPALVPLAPLEQRAEGWWWDWDRPLVWHCPCEECGPGTHILRDPVSPGEVRPVKEPTLAVLRRMAEDAFKTPGPYPVDTKEQP